jgi:hypothetical protein
MQKIDLIIPAKEKSEHIIILLNNLIKIKFIKKIIVVLEKDKNIIFKNNRVIIINQKKRGYGSAIKDGFKKSKNKYACIFNADGSFNIFDLPGMLNLIKNKHFIFASRYEKNAGSEDDTLLTRFGNFFFTKLGRYLLGINLSDILYTYVLCDRKKFLSLNLKNNDFRLCVELPYKVKSFGYFYDTYPSYEYARKYGEKNLKEFKDGFLILLEIIKCFIKNIKKKF